MLVALIRLGEKEKERDPTRDGNYLRRLAELDLLFMACASLEMRDHLLKSPGKNRIAAIQEYIERLDPEEKPLINLWRSESNPDRSPTCLLGSLKVPVESQKAGAAEKKFYQLVDTAILLHRHAKGQTLAQLSVEYKLDEGVLEQGVKSTALWVLSGLAQICDSRKCYKLDFLMMRTLELIEKVTYGSGLAPLLKLEGIGKRTIQKLTESGYRQVNDLEAAKGEDLRALGLLGKQVKAILKTVRRTRR